MDIETHTEGRTREDRGRDWSNVTTCPGGPGSAQPARSRGGGGGAAFLVSLEGTSPANTLNSDSWPPGWEEGLVFSRPTCGAWTWQPRTLTQAPCAPPVGCHQPERWVRHSEGMALPGQPRSRSQLAGLGGPRLCFLSIKQGAGPPSGRSLPFPHPWF